MTITHARPELIQVADTVAREKSIDREEVIEAMEQAIQKAGRSKYGPELDIRASIGRSNGEILLARYREVVEEVENEQTELTQEEADRIKFFLQPLHRRPALGSTNIQLWLVG